MVLGFENDKDAETRRKSDRSSAADSSDKPASRKKKKGAVSADVGSALRSAYQRTVEEQIPPDLLDLLGKLG